MKNNTHPLHVRTAPRAFLALFCFTFLLTGKSLSAAVTFDAGDIVDGQIVFAYNGLDNRTYINGVSTGKSFASSGATVGGVGRYDNSSHSTGFLSANSTAVGTYSFSWDFTVPTGYEIASASLTYRLLSPAGSVAGGNEIDLNAAVDGGASFNIATLTTTSSTDDTHLTTYTFPVDTMSGATSLSIAGTVILNSVIGQPYLEMFDTTTPGAAGSAFILNLTLQPIPEPSAVALLIGGAGLIVAAGVRLRKRLK